MLPTLLLSTYSGAYPYTNNYLQSTDGGATWTHRSDMETAFKNASPRMLADPTGQYVLAQPGQLYNAIYSSVDGGATFQLVSQFAYAFDTIDWVNGQFVGWYSSNNNDRHVYASPTGADGTWVQKGFVSSGSSVATFGFLGGQYVLVTGAAADYGMLTSPDLVTWTAASGVNGGTGPFKDGSVSTGGYAAAYIFSKSDASEVVLFPSQPTSGSGASGQYTTATMTNPAGPTTTLPAIAYPNGASSPAVGSDSLCAVLTSSGVHWFDLTNGTEGVGSPLPSGWNASGLTYANGTFYLVGSNNNAVQGMQVYTSTDAKTWTLVYSDAAASAESLVAIAAAGPSAPPAFWEQFQGAVEHGY